MFVICLCKQIILYKTTTFVYVNKTITTDQCQANTKTKLIRTVTEQKIAAITKLKGHF
jgi:hypothetical protein